MKKTLSFVAAMLVMGAVMAQTIVSTEVEKRNVLIEEFTGVGCGYCPDGHARANAICQQYAGHAWAINIHQGGYATGSGYETQWGDGLASQYNIQGYPCGVTNRCANIQNRGEWAGTAAQIRTEDSPVNLGAVAHIDPMTRQLTVDVEAYYTADQAGVSSNFLNVVLLQSNIIGPQSNYGNYNADYITADGQYRHMHMLRDMLTGQWGEEITTISSGTLVQRSYTYTLPASIGAVDIEEFEDLQVLVFMTETHKNVLTANEASLTIAAAAYCSRFSIEGENCDVEFLPILTIKNTTDETVTDFVISLDGTEYTFIKQIAAGASDTFHLPTYVIEPAPTANVHYDIAATLQFKGYYMMGSDSTVVIADPADVVKQVCDINVVVADGPYELDLAIDHYGSEVHAYLFDQSNCGKLWETQRFTNLNVQQLRPARHYYYTLDPGVGTIIFSVTDEYGDGATYVSDEPGFSLRDANGNIVLQSDGDYGEGISVWLVNSHAGEGAYVGIEEAAAAVSFSLYPNPATDRLNVECGEGLREVTILDVTGRTVVNAGTARTINVSGLAAGVYMVRVATDNGIGIQKFVKE